MRFLIYGTLLIITIGILIDTNIGVSVDRSEMKQVNEAIGYIKSKRFDSDAALAERLARSGGFRRSRFFAEFFKLTRDGKQGVSYYAYTPILSTTKIFIGENFWDVGKVGHSSVIIHELAHLRRHKRRILRGFPRGEDEAEAYRRQYLTYRRLGLSSTSDDSIVYWDMMIGVQTYVLPIYPEFKNRPDIKAAMYVIDQGSE